MRIFKSLATRGFSLTEVLVTVGLLAILSSIATVSYNSYITAGKAHTVKTTLDELESAFRSCMSVNKFDATKCNEFGKIGFILPNSSQCTPATACAETKVVKAQLKKSTDNSKICLVVRRPGSPFPYAGKEGTRGCVQYDNGILIRKCLEKTGIKAECSAGVCCSTCADTLDCEYGKGAKEPATTTP